jgi:hypothetical protein
MRKSDVFEPPAAMQVVRITTNPMMLNPPKAHRANRPVRAYIGIIDRYTILIISSDFAKSFVPGTVFCFEQCGHENPGCHL